MPRAGGDADKSGNRYESLWTVKVLLRLLNEEFHSVYLEPLGPEGDGIEFIVTRTDGSKEYHQVKRQYSGFGPWTLKALASRGLLKTIQNKLSSDNKAHFYFVSMSNAPELYELSEDSRSARSFDDFKNHFISASIDRTSRFKALCNQWCESTEDQVFQWLRNVHVETITEETLQCDTEYRAAILTSDESAD